MGNDDQAVDVRELGPDVKEFEKWLTNRQEAKLGRDEAEAIIKECTSNMVVILAAHGFKTVLTPEWRTTFTQGSSTRISKEKLLELGVSAETIRRATVTTTYETVTVTLNKQD